VARFVAAFVIGHFSYPIPRSEFRIPHFLAGVAADGIE